MPADASSRTTSVCATRHGDVLLLALADPTDFPRLTRAVLYDLRNQTNVLARASELRAAVLTGTEKCFAAGAELEEVAALTPREALHFSALGQSVMRAIERSAKPIVAGIRGFCLGGGFDLAMACHLRVAATDAVFGHPGGSLGILTGWGGTQRLPRLLARAGRSRALEALTTGRRISAEEAHAWGLVNRLAPPEEAVATAILLVTNSLAQS